MEHTFKVVGSTVVNNKATAMDDTLRYSQVTFVAMESEDSVGVGTSMGFQIPMTAAEASEYAVGQAVTITIQGVEDSTE